MGKRVLVIEDEPNIIEALSFILSRDGWTVHTHSDGVNANERIRATPPDLVRETAELIPGYRFHLMQGVGHLPMVEQPETFAALLKTFLAEIGHI